MKLIHFTVLFTLIAFSVIAQDKVAVLPTYDIEKKVNDSYEQMIRERLATAITNSQEYAVIDFTGIDAIIDLKSYQDDGIITEKAKIELGNIPGCKYVLRTEVSTDNKHVIITVKMLYTETLQMVPNRSSTEYAEINAPSIYNACDKIIKGISDNNAEFYYKQGNYYYEKNENIKAQLSYSMAIELKPDYAEAYCKRGTTWGQDGVELIDTEYGQSWDLSKSKQLSDLNKAIELNPKYADAYYARAWFNYNLFLKEQMIADFSTVIELKPNDVTIGYAYFYRSWAYSYDHRYDEAISDLTNAILYLSKDHNIMIARVYAYRACVYKLNKENEKAKNDIIKAKEIDPDIDKHSYDCEMW